MFAVAGESAGAFCAMANRLGRDAAPLDGRLPDEIELLHVEAPALLAGAPGERLQATVEAARRRGALISVDLGSGEVAAAGGPRAVYRLATIQPDLLFAREDAAHELGVPLEGLASVPVVLIAGDRCSVYGRTVFGRPGGSSEPAAFEAAFCVAFCEGAGPVESAGRAILLASEPLD